MARPSPILLAAITALAACQISEKPPDNDLAVPPPRDLSTPLMDDRGRWFTPCLNGDPGCTGDPCTKVADCAKGLGPSQGAVCIRPGYPPIIELEWPGGYCTSSCRPARNDPQSGINPDCPGGNATCEGSGTNAWCVTACLMSSECRAGYACFTVNNLAFGCLPKAISECDPAKAATCPRMCGDGGVPDGGSPCFENTCLNIGDGTVGECVPGCDIFSNTGCAENDCHASDVTGEGICTDPCNTADCQNGNYNGACGNFWAVCWGGYGCLDSRCRKYCNDANVATQCAPGATCMKLSPTTHVPTSVAGLCSK